MTKEEYQKSIKELEKKQIELRERKEKIRQEYISSNTEFKIGDKIKITSDEKTQIGQIIGYSVACFTCEIVPIVFKVKRNGNRSFVREIYIYGNEKIEKYSE